MVFRTLFAAIITADNTKKAPTLAAIGKDQLETECAKKYPPKERSLKLTMQRLNLRQKKYPVQKAPLMGF